MRHGASYRTLGMNSNQRSALLLSLARELVLHETIKTTEARAKELRPRIEKLITRAKVDSVANRRVIASRVGNDAKVVKKLFEVIAPRFKDRNGGYTRITKLGTQGMDARSVAQIELV